MTHTATLIPGDGIGPEVTAAAVRVLSATGVDFEWETENAGAQAAATEGHALPERVLASIRRNRVALKGPTGTPVGGGHRSVNVELRRTLDLFANLRPVSSLPGVASRFQDVDLVVVRENTEDLYSGLEHVVVPGVVESLKIITDKASTRVARFAFAWARAHERKKITAVHKANIMKLSDGLFLECCRRVSAEYDDIAYEELIVDNTAMQLVLDPSRFDVLLLPNLYGDIVSDLCAGLTGGLGMAPGANIGESCAIFEAVHGSAPDIAGRNLANPMALVLSSALMLEHLGETGAARRVRSGLRSVLSEGRTLTPDLGGRAGTTEVAEAIAAKVASAG